MGDGASRHRSALRSTESRRVVTHHNKSLKFEEFSIQNLEFVTERAGVLFTRGFE